MSIAQSAGRRLTPLEPLVEQIESAEALDPAGQTVGKAVRDSLNGTFLKEVLSGTWLGHAVHPMLTDVVIGSFTSASLLDVLAPRSDGTAGERLIAIGLAAYVPTAAAGISDWADTEPVDAGVRRAGLVHAGCNPAAMTLYAASLRARRRGARGRGTLLGLAGMTVLTAGGYLGAHLSLRKGVGPDQTVFDPGPAEWTVAADASLLPERRPLRVVVDDTPVFLLRDDRNVYAIHDRCSHRGCSLSEGTIEGTEVTCACHGSRFDVRDGSIKRGPATAAQPAFQVRVEGGRIEIRRLHA